MRNIQREYYVYILASKRLVYFEVHGDVRDAIGREKQIKGWNRAWKIRLIEKHNPEWMDLYRGG